MLYVVTDDNYQIIIVTHEARGPVERQSKQLSNWTK